MKRAFPASCLILLFLSLAAPGCRSGGDLSKPETQRQFGVRMAKMNLWREAMFRFQREVEISPENAMAHNNLAVAAEANGDFDLATKEYREALRLDRSNQYIQKNYSRFVEFTQKSRKRDAKPAAPAATTTATPAAEPPASAPATGPAPVPAVPPTTTAPDEPAAQAPPPPETTTTNPPAGGAR